MFRVYPARRQSEVFFCISPSAFLFHSSAVGRLWVGLLFSFIMLAIIQRRRLREGWTDLQKREDGKRHAGATTGREDLFSGKGKGARRIIDGWKHYTTFVVVLYRPSIAFSEIGEKTLKNGFTTYILYKPAPCRTCTDRLPCHVPACPESRAPLQYSVAALTSWKSAQRSPPKSKLSLLDW
jgi:hypothetical protein